MARVPDPRAASPESAGRGGSAAERGAREVLRLCHTASKRRTPAESRVPAHFTAPHRQARTRVAQHARGNVCEPETAICTTRRDPRPPPAGARNGGGRRWCRAGPGPESGYFMEHPLGRGCPVTPSGAGGEKPPNPCNRLRSPEVVASPHHVSNHGLKLAGLQTGRSSVGGTLSGATVQPRRHRPAGRAAATDEAAVPQMLHPAGPLLPY